MNRFVPLRRTTWRQNPEEAGGGALIDLGVQALDLLLWVLGGPTVRRVSAVMSRDDREVENAANVLMETDTGVAMSVEVSWSFFAREDTHYVRVLGHEGSGQLPPLEIFKQLGGRPMDVTPEQGSPPRKGGRFLNAHIMSIIHAAYDSARGGCEVEL